MSELLREIEEDIRAERARGLWQKFGKSMVWVSVAIVAGTAAGVLWKDYRESKSAQQTSLLISATRQAQMGNQKEALAQLDALAEHKDSAHAALALLHKADLLRRSGDDEGARTALRTLAAMNDDKTRPFAALARLKLAEGEASPPADAPFRLSLMENEAWSLLAAGKAQEASSLFAALEKDADAPASMRNRAMLALQTLAAEGGHD